MKKRVAKKNFEYISDDVIINSEVELTNEQVEEVCKIAQEIKCSMSFIHSNEIAEKIYFSLEQPIFGVEIFDKNKILGKNKIFVKIIS